MDTNAAIKIAGEAAQLTVISAQFQAEFGKGYRIPDIGSDRARELREQGIEHQRQIARMLDKAALEHPLERWGHWWEDMDMMSIALAAELAQEVNRLISAVVYQKQQPQQPDWSHNVDYTQRAIAGALHPIARTTA